MAKAGILRIEGAALRHDTVQHFVDGKGWNAQARLRDEEALNLVVEQRRIGRGIP